MSIKYGTDRNHLSQSANANQSSDGRNFHAHLQGLRPNTRYYFQVMENGSPVGGVGTFLTVSPGAAPVRSKAVIPQ
jgi:phosphodiesterase/alkaline phosphatase D-like protein